MVYNKITDKNAHTERK